MVYFFYKIHKSNGTVAFSWPQNLTRLSAGLGFGNAERLPIHIIFLINGARLFGTNQRNWSITSVHLVAAYNASVSLAKNFTDALLNSSSPEYQAEAAAFCDGIKAAYNSSDAADEYRGCMVTGFE